VWVLLLVSNDERSSAVFLQYDSDISVPKETEELKQAQQRL
jgi:hypothetical protein